MRIIPVVLVAALLATGCSAQTARDPAPVSAAPAASAPAASANSANLEGTDWRFVEVAGVPVPPDVTATLRLRDGRASGKAGCNAYGASYAVAADGSAHFQRAMSTKMACLQPKGAMRVEHGVFEALRNAARVERKGDTLILLDATGKPLAMLRAQASP